MAGRFKLSIEIGIDNKTLTAYAEYLNSSGQWDILLPVVNSGSTPTWVFMPPNEAGHSPNQLRIRTIDSIGLKPYEFINASAYYGISYNEWPKTWANDSTVVFTFPEGFASSPDLDIRVIKGTKGKGVVIYSNAYALPNFNNVKNVKLSDLVSNIIYPNELFPIIHKDYDYDSGYIYYAPTVPVNDLQDKIYSFNYTGNDYIDLSDRGGGGTARWLGLVEMDTQEPIMKDNIVLNSDIRHYFNVVVEENPKGILKMWEGSKWTEV